MSRGQGRVLAISIGAVAVIGVVAVIVMTRSPDAGPVEQTPGVSESEPVLSETIASFDDIAEPPAAMLQSVGEVPPAVAAGSGVFADRVETEKVDRKAQTVVEAGIETAKLPEPGALNDADEAKMAEQSPEDVAEQIAESADLVDDELDEEERNELERAGEQLETVKEGNTSGAVDDGKLR